MADYDWFSETPPASEAELAKWQAEAEEAKVRRALSSLRGINVDIRKALDYALNKHTFKNTPFNPHMDVRDAYVILMEEVGEVARAMTYDEGNPQDLQKELIQVAAMAIAMLSGVRARLAIEKEIEL